MSTHGGASLNFHVDQRYTTLELIGGRDCVDYKWIKPDLLVWGGARIEKSLCIGGDAIFDGDVIIEGNLAVLGDKIIQEVELVVIEDKNICLGNVAGGPASDLTAHGGGVVIKGPQPGGSKTWLWYNDIGPDGAWNSNQDINIGIGRLTSDGGVECPGCGSDTLEEGFAYRVDGNVVLTRTSLGETVTCSFLEKVATLRKGAIDNATPIIAITPAGAMTCVDTSEEHCLETGDEVNISGTDSTSTIDGCRVVMVTSPTQFKVMVTTSVPGTTGIVHGPNFPINIGTSPIDTGTHTVQCGNDLIVNNDSGVPVFFMGGTTEQLDLTNTTSQPYTQRITTDISGTFPGVQRGLFVDNASRSTTIGSESIATDIRQCYGGTNTTLTDIETTVFSIGQRVEMKTNVQFPTPKHSARGIDVSSNSPNNCGSNVGVYAEGGGPSGTEHSAGVIGFTNDDSGSFATGVMGCANLDRAGIAQEVDDNITAGGQTVGVYACNPDTGPTDWGLCVAGRTKLNGDVEVSGNTVQNGNVAINGKLTATEICVDDLDASGKVNIERLCVLDDSSFAGNVLVAGVTTLAETEIFGNLTVNAPSTFEDIVPGADQTFTLGSPTEKWNEVWTQDLNVCGDQVIEGDLTVLGTIFANVSVIIPDPLIVDVLCANDHIETDRIEGKTSPNISVAANLLPDGNLTLGNEMNMWCEGHFKNLFVAENVFGTEVVTGNTFTGNTACFGDVKVTDTIIGNVACFSTVKGDSVTANIALFDELDVEGNATMRTATIDTAFVGNLLLHI